MAREGRLKSPTVYQVYPRSFRDTTGTGEGDLQGVILGLDHIRDLGVDAIWLSPFFVSPMTDGGYDIVDHRAVDPRFGTLDDVDALIAAAHDRGLAVIFDLVFNHTSCEHPDFLAAIDGDDDAAARYVWRDPKPDGGPPNNWISFFGEPAWLWNHKREQYYFHQFLTCQPSLDLRHDAVQADHRRTVEFWCDRGVDGFRMDAITSYLFDPSMKDNPPAAPEVSRKVSGPPFNPYTYQDHVYDLLPGDGAEYGETVRRWAGPDMWLVGENNSGNRTIEMSTEFSRDGRLDGAYVPFMHDKAGDPQTYADLIDAMDGNWIAPWWLSNHDGARHISAHGDGSARSAKFYALLLSVLPGAIMIYQGEELGLPQPDLPKDVVTDPFDLLYWPDGPGREGARVPVPWTEDRQASYGFSDGTPWLPMAWVAGLSVAAQADDPHSVMSFYRRVLALRRDHRFSDPDGVTAEVASDALHLTITVAHTTYRAVFSFGDTPMDPPPGDIVVRSDGEDGALGRFAACLVRA